MSKKMRALAGRGAQALTTAALVVAGVAVAGSAAHATLPVPTITSVFVAGSTTNKVVTAGTTVVITGTGFTGMTDNAAAARCTDTPGAFPSGSPTSCSQVRFYGVSSTATTGYALATRYNVMSDTTILATVPTITPYDGTTAGSPVAGTGSIKVQVVNTMPTATSSLISASTASELFYRKPLTATLAATNASPLGGGVVSVTVTGAASLNSTTFPQEKITAYVYSTSGTSPQVSATSVTLGDTNHVNVTLPAGSPDGNAVGVMLVHDGIPGTADTTHLKYPAVITKLETCSADTSTFISSPTTTLPTCTGTANISSSASTADIKVTGKGMTGAGATFDFSGGGTIASTDCAVLTDTLAYCHIAITTPPTSGVAAVFFVPVDPDSGGPATAPSFVPTAGSILLYNTLV